MTYASSARLAVDAMGGDLGPAVIVAACRQALTRHSGLSVQLVGDEATLNDLLAPLPEGVRARVTVVPATEVVMMTDAPSTAIRRKKDSSMRVALGRVADGHADACISCGNTGALMALSRMVLRMIPGIDRPAIMAELPARAGRTFMLDVGANASCDTEHLYQFAVMGSVVAANLLEKTAPTVGLLNIGTEAGKGHDEIREADERLANSPLNYVGFVEGNALFNPVADVIVTDGFTGNVALKTIEGTATMVGHILKTEFTRSWLSKLQGLLAQGVLRRAAAQLDPRTYNGASLVGVDGVVIKSHGSSDAVAFATAIDTALLELADNVPAAIRRGLTNEAA